MQAPGGGGEIVPLRVDQSVDTPAEAQQEFKKLLAAWLLMQGMLDPHSDFGLGTECITHGAMCVTFTDDRAFTIHAYPYDEGEGEGERVTFHVTRQARGKRHYVGTFTTTADIDPFVDALTRPDRCTLVKSHCKIGKAYGRGERQINVSYTLGNGLCGGDCPRYTSKKSLKRVRRQLRTMERNLCVPNREFKSA